MLRISFVLLHLNIYEIPCDINRGTFPQISVKGGPLSFLWFLSFSTLDLNYHHYASTYSLLHLIYPVKMWGWEWCTINRGSSPPKYVLGMFTFLLYVKLLHLGESKNSILKTCFILSFRHSWWSGSCDFYL